MGKCIKMDEVIENSYLPSAFHVHFLSYYVCRSKKEEKIKIKQFHKNRLEEKLEERNELHAKDCEST